MRWSGRRRLRPGRRRAEAPSSTCIQVVELLTDYLEGALRPSEQQAVASHLAECPDCARYLEQLRATSTAVRGLPQPPLPRDACAALVAAFRGFRRR